MILDYWGLMLEIMTRPRNFHVHQNYQMVFLDIHLLYTLDMILAHQLQQITVLSFLLDRITLPGAGLKIPITCFIYGVDGIPVVLV